MNLRDDQREWCIAKLSQHLIATGLSQTSLRQLAAAAGVSDRMLLYYFSDKAEVLATTLERIAGELADKLAQAIPEGTTLPPRALVLRTAAFSTQADMRSFMRLWIELVAAAAAGTEPFATIAGQIAAGFLVWIDSRLDVPHAADRQAIAAAILALIDGLALLEVCSGEELTSRAVDALGLL